MYNRVIVCLCFDSILRADAFPTKMKQQWRNKAFRNNARLITSEYNTDRVFHTIFKNDIEL